MKKDELKKAYEELRFRKDLPEVYYQNIVSGKLQTRTYRGVRLASVMLVVCLLGTTVYAARRLDWFQWLYGEDYALIQEKTDSDIYHTQNEHLRMSVENAVFSEEYGKALVHIQALDEEGKQFMSVSGESCYPGMIRVGEELEEQAGSGCNAKPVLEFSDEENWYYQVDVVTAGNCSIDGTEVVQVSYPSEFMRTGETPEDMEPLVLEFPVKQVIGEADTYTKCGEFQEVSISAFAVVIKWNYAEGSAGEHRVAELKITMKDGSELFYEDSKGGVLGPGWESVGTWKRNGQAYQIMRPEKLVDIRKIESVMLNGVICTKK